MTEQERREWLAGLKVGDEVAVSRGYQNMSFEKVTHVTQHKIDVGKTRYRRKDGHKEGGHDIYWSVLHFPSDELKQKCHDRQLRDELKGILYALSVDKLPIATVRQLLAILKSAKDTDQ